MKLKLLLVPFFVIMSLVVAIGLAKPEYDTWVLKKKELAQKKTEVDHLETLRSNIEALTASLDQNKDIETFMLRFYPEKLDQERIIDAFNFISSQSGLIVTGMDVKELTEPKVEEDPTLGEPLISAPDGSVNPPAGEEGLTTPVYIASKPSSYVAQVKLKGSYENIKSFFSRLYKLDRMHEVKNISVMVAKKEDGSEGGAGDLLEASFEARFDYVSGKDDKNEIGAPIFTTNSFDLAKANKAKEWASTSMADLTVDKTSRANPFQ